MPRGIIGAMDEPGTSPAPDPHAWMRDTFLRLLGAIYLAAFLSLWFQVEGLIGSRGILPVHELLELVRQRIGASRYWILPTVLWMGDSDRALHFVCAAGALLSIVALLGRARPLVMLGLWALYLSLSTAGEDFLSFQWDALLLEAGLLAVFLAPRGWPAPGRRVPSRLVVWLYRWLLFRLMFGSGVVKLRSGDPTWRSLTALQVHYETQPLPTWIGYFAHHLPAAMQKASTAVMFVIELALPLLIWAPPRWRRLAAAGFLLLQVLIAATGNYAFFNLLTAALCVFLLDPAGLPRRLRPRPVTAAAPAATVWGDWPRAVLVPFAAVIVLVSTLEFSEGTLGLALPWPAPAVWMARAVSPLRSINTYGLFAVMTTTRAEVVIEGSDDAQAWRPYEFRYKPGDVRRRPTFVAPHQPRLDWQMWFAALGSCDQSPWLQRLFQRLLEGSPPVLGLLGTNPFPDRPPRFVRALVYDYHFTDLATRRRTGEWWQRRLDGEFCPITARPDEPAP
jgi:lipase maturation factor 1